MVLFPIPSTFRTGKLAPARVLVLGAGVAGLAAIQTAKNMGAVVLGYDVRPVVQEQVESMGGQFLKVRSPRFEVLRHRLRERRSWLVTFAILMMLRAGPLRRGRRRPGRLREGDVRRV